MGSLTNFVNNYSAPVANFSKNLVTNYGAPVAAFGTFAVQSALTYNEEPTGFDLIGGVAAIALGFYGSMRSLGKIISNEERSKHFAHLTLYVCTLGIGAYKVMNVWNTLTPDARYNECQNDLENALNEKYYFQGKFDKMEVAAYFGSQRNTCIANPSSKVDVSCKLLNEIFKT